MTWTNLLLRGIVLIPVLCSSTLVAGPIDSVDHPHQESLKAVHEAEHAVDHAWEVYHRAALGGTVASPRLQAEIEEHLHQARTLIAEAHEAIEQGGTGQVEHLITKVRLHTTYAIEGSKEPKK